MVRRERDSHTLSLALSHTDTFDLDSVQFIAQVANVCVECCFINGSTAQGCYSEQRNFKSIVVRTFNASRLNGSLTTGRQCFSSDPGEYTVVVFDINSDSTLSEDPYTSSLIIVPSPPPSSTRVPIPTIVPTRGNKHCRKYWSSSSFNVIFIQLVLRPVPMLLLLLVEQVCGL